MTAGIAPDGTAPPLRIVAALILDEEGRLLLVRKRGTAAFMQPGGKIEPGEAALDALARELREELGAGLTASEAEYVGMFTAPAANEPGRTVEAAVYRVRVSGALSPGAEIAELRWLDPRHAADDSLAPLTRDHLLPLAASGATRS